MPTLKAILFCNFWLEHWLVRIANVYGCPNADSKTNEKARAYNNRYQIISLRSSERRSISSSVGVHAEKNDIYNIDNK